MAVSEGKPESLRLAEQLAEAVLAAPLPRDAMGVLSLARMRSPFALVRAVELAEGVLSSEVAARVRSRTDGT